VPLSLNEELALATGNYPIQAVVWARANPDQIGKKVFNDYGAGGMFLWKFPEQKTFIDGRMPHWRLFVNPETKESVPARRLGFWDPFPEKPEGWEEKWIFREYDAITMAEPGALELLDRYEVDWALTRVGRPIYWVLSGQEQTWQRVYQDAQGSVIFVKTAGGPEAGGKRLEEEGVENDQHQV